MHDVANAYVGVVTLHQRMDLGVTFVNSRYAEDGQPRQWMPRRSCPSVLSGWSVDVGPCLLQTLFGRPARPCDTSLFSHRCNGHLAKKSFLSYIASQGAELVN